VNYVLKFIKEKRELDRLNSYEQHQEVLTSSRSMVTTSGGVNQLPLYGNLAIVIS